MSDCCCSPKPIKNEIEINSNQANVRQQFVMFDTYPTWNPLYKYMNLEKGDINDIYDKASSNSGSIELLTEVRLIPIPSKLIVYENLDMNINWTNTVCCQWCMFATVTNEFQYDASVNKTTYIRTEIWKGLLAGCTSCCCRDRVWNDAESMCAILKQRCESSSVTQVSLLSEQ